MPTKRPNKTKNMSMKRVARIKDIVETLPRELSVGRLRYDVLNELARRHGIDYETLKRDLYALSYAFYHINKRVAELVEIPPSYRPDVRVLRRLAVEGKIDSQKAEEASKVFLEHAPWIDIERITREHGIKDKEVLEKVREFTKILENIYRKRVHGWKAHPAKAYAFVWNIMGRKIHQELANTREVVEKLYTIAKKINEGKRLSAKEREFLQELKIDKDKVFDYIDPKKPLSENLRDMYLRVLRHNLTYAKAMFHYESAKLHHIGLYNIFKDKLEKLGKAKPASPGSIRSPKELKLGDKIENAYKAIRRWPHSPNVKPRDFPRYFKELARDAFEDHYNPKTKRFENLPKGDMGKVKKILAIIGYHRNEGNQYYKTVKEAERKDPVLAWIVKRTTKR